MSCVEPDEPVDLYADSMLHQLIPTLSTLRHGCCVSQEQTKDLWAVYHNDLPFVDSTWAQLSEDVSGACWRRLSDSAEAKSHPERTRRRSKAIRQQKASLMIERRITLSSGLKQQVRLSHTTKNDVLCWTK